MRLYKKTSSSVRAEDQAYQKIKSLIGDDLQRVQIETCYYVQFTTEGIISHTVDFITCISNSDIYTKYHWPVYFRAILKF